MAHFEAIDQAGSLAGQFPYTTDSETQSLNERRIQMWGRYGVDVQFSGFAPTPEQLAIIERILSELKQRPADLRLIDRIIFEGGHEHRNGAVSTLPDREIRVFGAFDGPVHSKPSYYRHYNVDMADVWADPSDEVYLREVLIHEQGHFAYYYAGNDAYQDLIPRARIRHEFFAEDYRLYWNSDGQEVMERRGSGCRVRNYDERLETVRALSE